jgi:lipopolysaccharide biosynthesis regulator YciM
MVYKSGTEAADQRKNLRAAEELVRRALKIDPKNVRAEVLLKEIKDLQALLP